MQKLLYIGKIWPEPTSSAAGTRMLQLIDLFVEEDFEVIFASTATKTSFSHTFNPHHIKEKHILLNDASFPTFVQGLKPDVVVFDRFMTEEQFGWQVRDICPEAITILDTQDLHFLRNARETAYKKNLELNIYTPITKREIASLLRCDLNLIISEVEMQLLITEFKIPTHILLHIPFLEDIPALNPHETKTFAQRENFVFIGNFLHEPNYQTVLKLKKEIWPILSKELPKVELHIYGAYASQKVQQLHHQKERFIIKGRADDAIKTLSNYSVLLAPIPFGAGIKGKFIDAMHSGTPSVTTSIGAESMYKNQLWNGYVNDDNAQLMQYAKILYQDKTAWSKAQQKGFEILYKLFDKNKYIPIFWRRFKEIKENLQAHRQANFMGEILKQNQLNSHKYMSLWIETKNRLKQNRP